MYSGFLLNPSPAQLRNLCLLLFENGLSKSDEEVFIVFFSAQNEPFALRKNIENFDVEKLRSIGNFLKGRSQRTNTNSLNLIAIMLNYQHRPYHKFLKSGSLAIVEKSLETENDIQIHPSIPDNKQEIEKFQTKDRSIAFKEIFRIGIVTVLLLAFYCIKQEFFPKKQCMQWNKDHYEAVDCHTVNQEMTLISSIIPLENREFNLKKIAVNQETIFFKNGKPQVWYGKINGEVVYFNAHGTNPESGKPLKPITEYIINKYILSAE